MNQFFQAPQTFQQLNAFGSFKTGAILSAARHQDGAAALTPPALTALSTVEGALHKDGAVPTPKMAAGRGDGGSAGRVRSDPGRGRCGQADKRRRSGVKEGGCRGQVGAVGSWHGRGGQVGVPRSPHATGGLWGRVPLWGDVPEGMGWDAGSGGARLRGSEAASRKDLLSNWAAIRSSVSRRPCSRSARGRGVLAPSVG